MSTMLKLHAIAAPVVPNGGINPRLRLMLAAKAAAVFASTRVLLPPIRSVSSAGPAMTSISIPIERMLSTVPPDP